MVVDIDGTADDGAGGCPSAAGCEDDDLEATVENVVGGSAHRHDHRVGQRERPARRRRHGNDVLNGAGSDDELFGGTGANTGPDGADAFNGGTGDDLATYEGRTDGVTASIGGGDDGAGGCPCAAGCEDDDVATDVEDLTGGGGSDTLTGDGDANDIDGGPASDVLAGGTATSGADGPDIFTGGTGTDQVTYANRTTPVFASIDGSAFDGHDCPVTGPCEKDNVGTDVEQLVGGSDDDELIGDADNNALLGNGGDDDLQGGETDVDGRDTFGGGSGIDRVFYSDKTRDLNVTLGGGNDGAGGCPDGAGCEDDNVPSDVEEVVGGDGDDTLTGSSDANQVIGGSGNDVLSGGGGADGADRLAGGQDTDRATFAGSSGNRELTIDGVANDGTSCPGASCEGDDIELDVENVTGGSGNDHIVGDLDANSFDGAGGDDTLEGGGTGSTADGADSFTGGPGTHDAVSYDNRTVSVTAVAGAGSVNGIGGCPGGAGCEDDVFAADIEDLTGGQEDDVLSGGSPTANTLDGQGGDDLLRGSASSTGPDGADVFIGGGHGTAGGANGSTGDLVDYGEPRRQPHGVDRRRRGRRGRRERRRALDDREGHRRRRQRHAHRRRCRQHAGRRRKRRHDRGRQRRGPGRRRRAHRRHRNRRHGLVRHADRRAGNHDQRDRPRRRHHHHLRERDRRVGQRHDQRDRRPEHADRRARDRQPQRTGRCRPARGAGRPGRLARLRHGGRRGRRRCRYDRHGHGLRDRGCAAAPPPDPDPPADPDPGTGAGSPPPPSGSGAPSGAGETGAGAGAGGGSGATGSTSPFSLTGNRTTLTLSSRGKLTIAVQGTPGASGQLTIASAGKVKVGKGKKAKRKVVTLAKARFRVGANGSVKVPLTVSASNRKLLAALKKINAVVTAATPGQPSATANVTIKPTPKRRRSR